MAKVVPTHKRTRLVVLALDLLFLGIIGRLFYWQIIHSSTLQAQAQDQYTRTITVTSHRGRIFTSDNYPLVINKQVYRLFAQPDLIKDPSGVAEKIAPLLVDPVVIEATPSASPAPTVEEIKQNLKNKLGDAKLRWVALKSRIDDDTKKKIEGMQIPGLGFDSYEARDYPEASMAAYVTGFVGKDKDGNDQGYFGVEGELDRELRGQTEEKKYQKDALGFHLLFGNSADDNQINGRDITLTIKRDVQYAVEDLLQKGIQKYGAVSGEAIVMDPKTGKILAMAAFPNYEQEHFYSYSADLYKNPIIADTYEPGSTFKLITMAAGIDTGVVKEDTPCTNCSSARHINEYTIKTWNDQYHPNITMKDAIAKSDNVAMIFVSELLGEDKFVEYIKRFKIGEQTHVELQEDTPTPLRKDWKPIDLATSSFGQGIVTTGMQMVRAVGAIANHGVMMRPTIVERVVDSSRGTDMTVQPIEEGRVVSSETASTMIKMMVYASETGEAKWAISKLHYAAGKTGTAQVPIAGHYDKDKTIASFIGFAPPEDPKFVMLIKLHEPKTSQWAAETAAPLWYQIADKLYLLLNIPPDK